MDTWGLEQHTSHDDTDDDSHPGAGPTCISCCLACLDGYQAFAPPVDFITTAQTIRIACQQS